MTKMVRTIKDFSGGLSEVANDNMRDNELAAAKNAVPGETYGLSRASGSTIAYPQISDMNEVMLLIELPLADSSTQVIAFTRVDAYHVNMYVYDSAGSCWNSVESGISAPRSYFTYANKLYWLDGTDYKYYDGTAVAQVTENGSSSGLWAKIKSAVAVKQRGVRWFFATTDNEVIFSDTGYCDRFTGTNVINISSGRTDSITALHEFDEGLLIFQKRSVFYLSGYSFSDGADIRLTQLKVSCGTTWPKTVKTVDNAVLYLGSNGLYRLYIPYGSEYPAARNISENRLNKRLRQAKATDCYAEVWNNIYYLALNGPGGIAEYRYFVSTNAFFGEYTQEPTCYAAGFLGEDYLYLGSRNGYILRYDEDSTHYIDTATGSPAPIPLQITTKGFDVCGAMVQYAKVKKVLVLVKQFAEQQSGLSLQLKADYLDTAWNWELSFDESLVYAEGDWGSGYWGWKDSIGKEIQLNQKTQRLQLTFYDETSDCPIVLYGIAMLYKKKKVRGNRDGVEQAKIIYED